MTSTEIESYELITDLYYINFVHGMIYIYIYIYIFTFVVIMPDLVRKTANFFHAV